MGKHAAKHQLRAEMKKILANLDRRWVNAASREVTHRLTALINSCAETRPVEHVLVWMPYFPGEVDLSSLISAQLNQRRVYVPRILPDVQMSFISIDVGWDNSLVTGQLGIPEPTGASGEAFDESRAESTLVLVPGLAFDSLGNRLGRGRGYYDRFLSRAAMAEATKVGVCFDLQITPEVPTESFDIAMDWVVSEQRTLRTGFNAVEGGV